MTTPEPSADQPRTPDPLADPTTGIPSDGPAGRSAPTSADPAPAVSAPWPTREPDDATAAWPAGAWTSPTPSGAVPPSAPWSAPATASTPTGPGVGAASPAPTPWGPTPAPGAWTATPAPGTPGPAAGTDAPTAGASPAAAGSPQGTGYAPGGAYAAGTGLPPAGAYPPGGPAAGGPGWTPGSGAPGSGAPGWNPAAGAPGWTPGTGSPAWTPGGGTPPWTPAAPPRPTATTPPGLVGGIILVVIGAALLLSRVVDLSINGTTWPLWVVVPGVAMLVGSFFIPPRGGLGLAIPGAIVTAVGLILWVQDAYGLYETWAYAWALVAPTAPGVAMLLYGIVHRDGELAGDGLRTALVGLGLFLGFALFFEGVLGLSGRPIANLEAVLPYAVIGLGVLLVVLSFFGIGSDDGRRAQRRAERQAARDARRAARHAR